MSIAAPAALTILFAAVLWFLWDARSPDTPAAPADSNTAETPSPDEPDPQDGSTDGSTDDDGTALSGDTLVILMDGWSMRIVSEVGAEGSLSVAFGDEARRPLGTFQATFRPATESDLQGILDVEPESVAKLAARMVRYDPLLRCDSDGCVSQRGDIPLSWLADVSDTPVFSASYEGWELEAGVLLAEVSIPVGATFGAIGGGGLVPAEFVVEVASDEVPSFEELSEEDGANEGTQSEGTAGTSLRRSVTIGSAFGVLFELSPTWLTTEGPFAGFTADAPFASENAAALSRLPEALASNDFLGKGLAFQVPELASATAGWLTLLSSPTYGCYAALCVPTLAEDTVAEVSSDTGQLCVRPGLEESTGVASTDVRLLGVGSLQTWRFDSPAPFHQTAFWDGRLVEDLEGHVPGGVGVFTGDPVLVPAGAFSADVYTVWVYSGDELVPHMVRLRDVDSPFGSDASWPGAAHPFAPC